MTKWVNLKAGVFLGYASYAGYTLLDRRLYLPREWVDDDDFADRRVKCGVPKDICFWIKPDLGWEMIRASVDDTQLRARWVACDEAFGVTRCFLMRSHAVGFGTLLKCLTIPGCGSSDF